MDADFLVPAAEASLSCVRLNNPVGMVQSSLDWTRDGVRLVSVESRRTVRCRFARAGVYAVVAAVSSGGRLAADLGDSASVLSFSTPVYAVLLVAFAILFGVILVLMLLTVSCLRQCTQYQIR